MMRKILAAAGVAAALLVGPTAGVALAAGADGTYIARDSCTGGQDFGDPYRWMPGNVSCSVTVAGPGTVVTVEAGAHPGGCCWAEIGVYVDDQSFHFSGGGGQHFTQAITGLSAGTHTITFAHEYYNYSSVVYGYSITGDTAAASSSPSPSPSVAGAGGGGAGSSSSSGDVLAGADDGIWSQLALGLHHPIMALGFPLAVVSIVIGLVLRWVRRAVTA